MTLKLLSILPTRGPNAFNMFLQSLHDSFPWVKEELLRLAQGDDDDDDRGRGTDQSDVTTKYSDRRWSVGVMSLTETNALLENKVQQEAFSYSDRTCEEHVTPLSLTLSEETPASDFHSSTNSLLNASGFGFHSGVIRNFVVGNDKLFVATDSKLYQMRYDLVEEKVKVISNSTYQNTLGILLPFESNRTLIICGTSDCGYCELLDISDISRTIYTETTLPFGPRLNESSVSFLVDYTSNSNGTYMLVGREHDELEADGCIVDVGVTLRNTLQTQPGDIFSKTADAIEAYIKLTGVKWVDGFQVSSQFESYLFANNVLRREVVLLKMVNRGNKPDITKSLKVATLHCCKDLYRHKLVSSTHVLSESSNLWVGIFTAELPQHPENTVLAIYNVTALRPGKPTQDFQCQPSCVSQENMATENPLAVVFKHSSMTSVAAKRKGSWTVLYIGTANGQLLKLVLDTEFRSSCAKVLYRSDDDTMVFPKMYFDPVDPNYIYMALRNQIKRVAVSQCGIYDTLRACLGSMDPFCGFCGITDSCSRQEECLISPWISSSKNSFQKELMLFQVVSVLTGEPEILSVWPNEVSIHGKNNAVIKGKNLELVVKIRFKDYMNCILNETPVLERSNTTLKFFIPSGNKEVARVCVVTADGRCHSNATIRYNSQPTCTELQPRVTWSSGERKIKMLGSNLEFVDAVRIHTSSKETILNSDNKTFWFYTPNQKEFNDAGPFTVSLRVANSTVVCAGKLAYHRDPEFTSFTTSKVVHDVLVTIQKKEDHLNISEEDLKVWGLQEEKNLECRVEKVKSSAVICKISGEKDSEITVDSLRIEFGNVSKILTPDPPNFIYILVTLIVLIVLGAVAGVLILRKSRRQMNAQMNEHLELLENEIRNEIRQGFVDLQTERSELVENVGAIPYLDYKHFALKIFFPEGGPLANQMVKEIGQDAVKTEMDERCQAFFSLIRNQRFLTCFLYALEEQKSFSIKDKCTVASLLTVTLHSDLPYLTQLMEELLQNLMDQPSNAQPKLLLRRTASIVEKLLTNWMSVCLYGFLRESVGQPLFLMISALNQQISKGPVDAVTEKALYTLNEDWLLWQAQGFNFSHLKLKVLFAVGTEGEVSEPLEVSVLTCDTIDQVKDKILQTFQRKFGFRFTQQLRDLGIEYMKEGSYMPLEEVDGSSEVQGEVTMLNTLKHYEIPDGACLKVITKKVHAPLSPQISLKGKILHKPGLVEVAVHTSVEMLFRSIWGMPNNKAPLAVKYFFDFLDSQAEKKKIMDPDVLHIWKTNSLPLRFWVNILKNPNFVFSDLEKTPHLDSCLSVIAQAFMDSFSLTDHQLGKHAPTNKLLYAKDIPQYKQEVKTYYKLVRDQQPVSTQDFEVFLQEQSKKHEEEFNEPAALRELYKYMERYFTEIEQHLEQKGVSCGLKEEMHRVKELFESVKRSAWN
ncbi:Plexin-C1 [Bagarius yarrelli]|uniref:Plexin-C1 n=1 Tax=Bagarius yarrelli TaxID=175774 RepID=A0A556TIA0_BAGYA|nr:Plexin-C1 [Bagarius yarrelli]